MEQFTYLWPVSLLQNISTPGKGQVHLCQHFHLQLPAQGLAHTGTQIIMDKWTDGWMDRQGGWKREGEQKEGRERKREGGRRKREGPLCTTKHDLTQLWGSRRPPHTPEQPGTHPESWVDRWKDRRENKTGSIRWNCARSHRAAHYRSC